MDKVDSARVSGLLGWLEEEQHQTKAQIGRFQYQLEQLANLTREQAGQIRSVHEEMAAARNQLNRLTAMDDLTKQLREALARLQSAQTEHLQETDKEDKSRQSELDRAKQAITDLTLRIDVVYKEFEPLLGRVQAMSDATKRHQDVVGGLVKGVDEISKRSETLITRVQVALDQGRRNEGDIASISRQLDTLHGKDDIAMARLQIVADKVRQVDEQIAAVLAEEQFKRDLSERLQVLRLEQQRLEKQLAEILPMIDIYAVRLDEQARELRQVDERRQGTTDDLKEFRLLLLDHLTRIEGYIIGVEELEERHRRRQAMELEHQANDLKERVAKLKGQVQ